MIVNCTVSKLLVVSFRLSLTFCVVVIRDGIPQFRPSIVTSPPSIPRATDHAPCCCETRDDGFARYEVPDAVFNTQSRIYVSAEKDSNGEFFYSYSSEDDVIYLVRQYLEDIIKATGSGLKIRAELS